MKHFQLMKWVLFLEIYNLTYIKEIIRIRDKIIIMGVVNN